MNCRKYSHTINMLREELHIKILHSIKTEVLL
nr:MAG TPA: hypothetical protein [Caudoviricetes sp.]